MWTLECDGDLFGGKRRWLRPGSTHLLGRTTGKPENGERIAYIEEKSVSRKHLIISVGPVEPGDSSHAYKKTEVRLQDGSKVGTKVDGEHLMKGSKTLEGRKGPYKIKLGHYEHEFTLKWEPVILTLHSPGKKGLEEVRRKLEGTDVKIVKEYITNETTHVVSRRRNAPSVLQGLVQGKQLVNYEWTEALAKAARRQGEDANGEPEGAPLEMDFDDHWPQEERYPIPVAQEPQPRPSEFLRPDLERAEVFQDFIFVFLAPSQYDSLMPVVTGGGGKAVLWEVSLGQSNVDELANYVKQVAGGKEGDRDFRLSQHVGRGGVVIVRIHEKGEEFKDWTRSFMQELEQTLKQRAIEQSELLDPILTLDTSGVRRQLALESEPANSLRQTPALSQQRDMACDRGDRVDSMEQDEPANQAPPSAQPEPEERPEEQPGEQPEEQAPEPPPTTTTRRRNRRPPTRSRFKAFDDVEMSQYARAASLEPESVGPSMREPSQAPSVQSMDVDEQSPPAQTQRNQQNSRNKRPAPIEEEPEPDEDVYESLFPGQAALKRRKTEASTLGEKSSFSKATLEADSQAAEKAARATKKKERQIDVQAELKARREKEDELRRKDEETLKEMMEGVDINELRNLAQVEVMDVPERAHPARGPDARGRGERWDPAWNGRKNFKKFRPQGQGRDAPRLQRVIVTLEEVPKKRYGVGGEYWGGSNASGKSKAKSQQSRSQSVRAGAVTNGDDDDDDDDEGEAGKFRRRLQRSYEEDEQQNVDEDVHPAEIASRPRDAGLSAIANGTSSLSQTLGTESQRKAAGKRPAAQQAGGPAKKARQGTLASAGRPATMSVEDEDEDDGLKFRRRRRG